MSKTTREEIIIKSAELISSEGIQNYSMQSLAKEIGIKKASLYHHFSSKEEIIGAMHEYYHALLLKKGYRITLCDDLESNLKALIKHWQDLFFSPEMYDYLRLILSMRMNDEASYEEWHSISLTIEGQSQVIFEKHTTKAQIISPLFSSVLELELERALINGESDGLEKIADAFIALSH